MPGQCGLRGSFARPRTGLARPAGARRLALPCAANRLGYMTNPSHPQRRDNACQRPPGDYSAPARKGRATRARRCGGMAEWLKALAWKACIRETVSWVRIPLPPPEVSSATVRLRSSEFAGVSRNCCRTAMSLNHFVPARLPAPVDASLQPPTLVGARVGVGR
jgi:hypothetical protein